MKNKKGFTLIELLAVIVILAVIALITIPKINSYIETAEDSSGRNSLDLYAREIENEVKSYMASNNGKVPYGLYKSKIETSGEVLYEIDTDLDDSNDKELENFSLSYNGSPIACDKIVISKSGNVYVTNCKSGDTKYIMEKETDKNYSHGNKLYADGEVIYFNPVITETCTGATATCLKFYAFGDTDSDYINLLYSKNVGSTIAFQEINLANIIGNWVNPSIKLKRLIKAEEVASIINSTFEVNSNSPIPIESPWLYDNLNNYTCYWTSTIKDDYSTWTICGSKLASMSNIQSAGQVNIYVRPVIEVKKSQLN